MRVPPWIRTSRLLQGDRQFGWYTRLRCGWQRWRYRAPASPWCQVLVDPNGVTAANDRVPKTWGLGQIRAGEWDRQRIDMSDNVIYRGLHERFAEGRPWEETRYYHVAEAAFAEGRRKWGYPDLRTFREVRCAYVDELFERIRDGGYRPNVLDEHEVPREDFRTAAVKRCYHRLEPLVVIDRNGEILWRDGFHRLAIAAILEIEAIPVNVLARHRAWQRHRDRVARGDAAIDRSHPDLFDLAVQLEDTPSIDQSSETASSTLPRSVRKDVPRAIHRRR